MFVLLWNTLNKLLVNWRENQCEIALAWLQERQSLLLKPKFRPKISNNSHFTSLQFPFIRKFFFFKFYVCRALEVTSFSWSILLSTHKRKNSISNCINVCLFFFAPNVFLWPYVAYLSSRINYIFKFHFDLEIKRWMKSTLRIRQCKISLIYLFKKSEARKCFTNTGWEKMGYILSARG